MDDPCPACGRSMLRMIHDGGGDGCTGPLAVMRLVCNGCGFERRHEYWGGLIMEDKEEKT